MACPHTKDPLSPTLYCTWDSLQREYVRVVRNAIYSSFKKANIFRKCSNATGGHKEVVPLWRMNQTCARSLSPDETPQLL